MAFEMLIDGLEHHAAIYRCDAGDKMCAFWGIENCGNVLSQEAHDTILALIDHNEHLNDQVHNLTLYLRYVSENDLTLWDRMMEHFSGMPGYGGETDGKD